MKQQANTGFRFDSVYFGGGTPSILSSASLNSVLEVLSSCFEIENTPEITLECNPSSAGPDRFKALLEIGIDRISLGVQSLDDRALQSLGRIHDSSQAVGSFEAARGAGFENISIDLIYGIPGQTISMWENDLRKIIALQPDHISAYNLIIEPPTPFGRLYEQGKLSLPSDDEQRSMYYLLLDMLTAAGYERYELSNFARDHKYSAHNLKYWTNRPYLGLGPSAVSFDGSVRSRNHADLNLYCGLISEGKAPVESSETIDRRRAMEERVMMGLRLSEGLSLSEFNEEFGIDLVQEKNAEIGLLESQGFLIRDDDRLVISDPGLFIADEIIVKLL